MADLAESNEWAPGVYQLETSDPVLGGPEGIDNLQAKQLANRTKWLRDQIQKIIDGVSTIGKAAQLANARTLKFKGAATGSGSYDGSADTEITLTLADSGIAAGSYTKITFNGKGLATGGGNPTTLAGYGITDAFSSSGGDVAGPVNLVDARSVNVVAATSASWAGGLHAVTKAAARNIMGGFGGWGNNDTLNNLYMALGSEPWTSGTGVRVTAAGTTITGPLFGAGGNLTGLRWEALANPPTTIIGYGISFTSQIEAETGADTNKPMNALRVFQAIAAKVVQATESVLGIARVATQTLVNAGADDTTIVTPKKLRWGFSISKATPGYILFPTWLGSLIIQWGTAGAVVAGSGITVTYPIAFTSANAMTLVGNSFTGGTTGATSSLGVMYGSLANFYIYSVGSMGQPNAPWIAVGW